MATIWKTLIDRYRIQYYERGDLIICNCPIHHGDNESAFNLNINPDSNYFGRWFCNTKKCHYDYHNDMIGLAHGLLSRERPVSFYEALEYCESLVTGININTDTITVDNVTSFLTKEQKVNKILLAREDVRKRLLIPPQFYLNKGFSAEILNEFDVGLCTQRNVLMEDRVVFPVYSEDGKFMIGCTGRTIVNHRDKWINSKGFSKSTQLYGYHRAIKRAKELNAIILVEGQGDVLKMHEAGVINTVGLFGSDISDAQEFLLQRTGIMNVVLAMDPDEAGKDAYIKINNKLKNLFNVHELKLTDKDLGDMTLSEIDSIKVKLGRFI